MIDAAEAEAEAVVQGIVTPRALVVVIDDRAVGGEDHDLLGPLVVELLEEADFHVDATTTVSGEHDDVHKVREGGLSRSTQTRAEDSWQRNAETVAHAVDEALADEPADLAVLTGDLRTVALVRDAVGRPTRERLVEVAGGGRGEGVHAEAFKARLAEAVTAFRTKRRGAVLARLVEALGRGDGAVSGLADVVEVLRRGQVAELVLLTDAVETVLGTRELWVGADPLELTTSAADLDAMGSTAPPRRMTAHVALLRAAVGQDAGVTVAEPGELQAADGVAALLRWSDPGTPPGAGLLSQSADRSRLRSLG